MQIMTMKKLIFIFIRQKLNGDCLQSRLDIVQITSACLAIGQGQYQQRKLILNNGQKAALKK